MAQVNQYIYYQNKASKEFLGTVQFFSLKKAKKNLCSALDHFFTQQTFMDLPE